MSNKMRLCILTFILTLALAVSSSVDITGYDDRELGNVTNINGNSHLLVRDAGQVNDISESEEVMGKRQMASNSICTARMCDPDRYDEYTAGLVGYNIFYGEPYFLDSHIDPGTRRQIFSPAVPLNDNSGRYGLNGITLKPLDSCSSLLKSEVITSSKQIQDRMLKSVSHGGGVGVQFKGEIKKVPVELGASAAFLKSKTMKRMSSFLSETGSAISIQEISCTTQDLKIEQLRFPQFTPGFKYALKYLSEATNKPKWEKERRFKKFVNQYGTHYMSHVTMGAKMTETRFFAKNVREAFTKRELNECSESTSKLSFVLGIGGSAQKSKSECSSKYKSKLGKKSELVTQIVQATRGSRPSSSIETWTKQIFTPVPLTMELEPISGLLDDTALSQITGITVNKAELRRWFKNMMTNYCSVFGINCDFHRGCGFADNCGFNQFCKEERGVPNCQNIPDHFTAKVVPRGEQFFVSWTLPYSGNYERFDGATFDVKYRKGSSGNYITAVRSYGGHQYTTRLPKSASHCCNYEFKVEAYDKNRKLINAKTATATRSLIRSGLGGPCTDNSHCVTGGTRCSGGRCRCKSWYYVRSTYCASYSHISTTGSWKYSRDTEGHWGVWESARYCPVNYYVHGYRMRIENCRSGCDDTALNGFRLYCVQYGHRSVHYKNSISTYGDFGEWQTPSYCYVNSPVIGFRIKIEGNQGRGDDTAATNMQLKCRNGNTIQAGYYANVHGLNDGVWSEWQECSRGYAMAGFQARQELNSNDDIGRKRLYEKTGNQWFYGGGDRTGLNGVRMICRKYD